MSNFFTEVVDDLDGLEQKLLGPDYSYSSKIIAPQDIGMSSDGNLGAMANDIAGLIAYTELLVSGGGKASEVHGALGDKFFLKTGAMCNDISSNTQVNRSIYINNVPEGNIPFISSGVGADFSMLRGIIPGIMGNLEQISPLEIFQSFMAGTNPDCQEVTMQTIDVSDNISTGSGYITTTDLNNMDPCWFPDNINPVTKETKGGCSETFANLYPNKKVSNKNNNETDILTETYITEISKIMTYVYLVTIIVIICYFISRLRCKK